MCRCSNGKYPRHRLDVLVNEDVVPVRIDELQERRPTGRFVGLDNGRDARALEATLNLAYVGEIRQRVPGSVPARIERQHVAVDVALEQTDDGAAVAENQPVLGRVAGHPGEPEGLIEGLRGGEIPDGQTD